MPHAGGRPSEYRPEFIKVAYDYMERCGREATELPTIEGLSLEIGCDNETLLLWGKDHPEFSDALKALKAKQKSQLMNDGLYGGKEVNSPMAIFLLKANHGMIETNALDLNAKGAALISFDLHGNHPLDAIDKPSTQTALGSGDVVEPEM